jgi:hypothetical protein
MSIWERIRGEAKEQEGIPKVCGYLKNKSEYEREPFTYRDVLSQALFYLHHIEFNKDLADAVKYAIRETVGISVVISNNKKDEGNIYLTHDLLQIYQVRADSSVRVRCTDYPYSIPLNLAVNEMEGEFSVRLYKPYIVILGGKRKVEKMVKGKLKARKNTWMRLDISPLLTGEQMAREVRETLQKMEGEEEEG